MASAAQVGVVTGQALPQPQLVEEVSSSSGSEVG